MSEQTAAIIERRFIYVHGIRHELLLEKLFWLCVEDVCRREKMTVHEFCSSVAPANSDGVEAAIRVRVLDYFYAATTEDGHRAAGHGSERF